MKEGGSEGVKKRRKERGIEGEERMKGGRNTTLWGFSLSESWAQSSTDWSHCGLHSHHYLSDKMNITPK